MERIHFNPEMALNVVLSEATLPGTARQGKWAQHASAVRTSDSRSRDPSLRSGNQHECVKLVTWIRRNTEKQTTVESAIPLSVKTAFIFFLCALFWRYCWFVSCAEGFQCFTQRLARPTHCGLEFHHIRAHFLHRVFGFLGVGHFAVCVKSLM